MTDQEQTAGRVEARRGFFPVVIGDEVSVAQAGAQFCVSRGNLSLAQGGGKVLMAGGDLSIRQGGSLFLAAGGDVSVSEGGAGVAVARRVHVERSYVGLVLGQNIEIAADSKMLLGPQQAAMFGAAAGLVCAMSLRLLTRRRRKR